MRPLFPFTRLNLGLKNPRPLTYTQSYSQRPAIKYIKPSASKQVTVNIISLPLLPELHRCFLFTLTPKPPKNQSQSTIQPISPIHPPALLSAVPIYRERAGARDTLHALKLPFTHLPAYQIPPAKRKKKILFPPKKTPTPSPHPPKSRPVGDLSGTSRQPNQNPPPRRC